MRAVQEMSGEIPEELNFPDPDQDYIYILESFWKVKKAAGENISYTELKNYMDLMKANFTAFEVNLIMQIDSIFEGAIHG